nr:hypothetical protein [Tanacetum cinerariifolium]
MANISGTDGSLRPKCHSGLDLKLASPSRPLDFLDSVFAAGQTQPNSLGMDQSFYKELPSQPAHLACSPAPASSLETIRALWEILILSLSLASIVKLSIIRRMPSAGSMASTEKATLCNF